MRPTLNHFFLDHGVEPNVLPVEVPDEQQEIDNGELNPSANSNEQMAPESTEANNTAIMVKHKCNNRNLFS